MADLLNLDILDRYPSPEASKSLVEPLVRGTVKKEEIARSRQGPGLEEAAQRVNEAINEVFPAYLKWLNREANGLEVLQLTAFQVALREQIFLIPAFGYVRSGLIVAWQYGALPETATMQYNNFKKRESCWDCEAPAAKAWPLFKADTQDYIADLQGEEAAEEIDYPRRLSDSANTLIATKCFECMFPA